jgi:hypothetical protein
MGDWHPLGPPPRRTRQDALQLAQSLETKARDNPEGFGQLAEAQSEDDTTKEFRGRLGAVVATEFLLWPHVLDALAAVKPGEISKVVETEFGFHVFRREYPPPQEQLAGRHLVVSYGGIDRSTHARGRDQKQPFRSRLEALKLAQQLAEEARRSPANFRELIRAHSEDEDVAREGDLGVWSNREPTYFIRELMVLNTLPVGAISDPLDTHRGFQVLQRETPTERQPYAMTAIRLPYNPKAPADAAEARQTVQTQAESIARVLRTDPSQFSRFQRDFCCSEVDQWTQGRGRVGDSELLDGLTLGQISPKPVEIGSAFVLVQRLDPKAIPAPAPLRFELPSPAEANLSRLVRQGRPTALARFCRDLAGIGKADLALTGKTLTSFEDLHESMAVDFEKAEAPEQKAALAESGLDRLRKLIGTDKYAQYRRLMDARVEALFLGPTTGR